MLMLTKTPQMITYELVDRTIINADHPAGTVIWQGKPLGCSIEKAVPLLGGTGCILLLDPGDFFESEFRYQGNIVFINSKGEMIWIAEVPVTKDVFVDMKLEANALIAYSWSGYRAQIDIENGKITNLLFTR